MSLSDPIGDMIARVKNAQDRSHKKVELPSSNFKVKIADILKKLPGIDIRPNGQIYYKDEPIQKYYIEGLDLLEGRYNLANNNLSADAVSKVEILENHQPVKVLEYLDHANQHLQDLLNTRFPEVQ